MSATGYIQVHAYTSNAQIPLPDTAIAITDSEGSAIALRLTDRSGMLAEPVAISVPDKSAGQTPDTGLIPFASVNLYARKEGFQEIEIRSLQIFPGTVTKQNLEMIPLPELPEFWNQTEIFDTTAQNL